MIFQSEFIAALAIGFLGSLHCLGMCGPIALVTPSAFPGNIGRLISGIIYNSGRVVTYTIMGAVAGSIGRSFALFKWQQTVSVLLGVLLVLSVVLPVFLKRSMWPSFGTGFSQKVRVYMGRFLKKTSVAGIFSIGLTNGLLPCGLVYIGLAGSVEMSTITNGALFMAFFGLGTFPMMSGLHLIGFNLKGSVRSKLAGIIPYFVVMIGIVFILRGLGLGIPYLSPSLNSHEGDINCHIPAHRHD